MPLLRKGMMGSPDCNQLAELKIKEELSETSNKNDKDAVKSAQNNLVQSTTALGEPQNL